MKQYWLYILNDIGEAVDLEQYIVSTVFLGSDHSFFAAGPAVLWETMVYKVVPYTDVTRGREFLDFQERYTSPAAARAGHETVVDKLISQGIAWLQGEEEAVR